MTRRYGKFATPEYIAWNNMRFRCMSPSAPGWKNYGGRGIRICGRWDDFANFLSDMGPRPSARHSIDRINNDGNYEPGNCRWATVKQQHENYRRPFGERNAMAKLTESVVMSMRRIRREERASSHAIAARFGVSQMTAYRAIVGQSWAHLPGATP